MCVTRDEYLGLTNAKSPTGRTDGARVILDRGLSLPPSGAKAQQRQPADRQQR